MISVVIVGSGNVATHLIKAFTNHPEVDLKQVYTRNKKDAQKLKSTVTLPHCLSDLDDAMVTIVSISDDAISDVSKKINNSFVVHTSGAMQMNELKNDGNKGVFYPLQSFIKNKEVNFDEVPFCIEASNHEKKELLATLAGYLSNRVYSITSEQRKYLHVSAVFANNFSNHMFFLANKICDEQNIPFEILNSLIQETTKKLKTLSPAESQTGPAHRNDKKTIQNHLSLLDSREQAIYKLITDSIQDNGKKL